MSSMPSVSTMQKAGICSFGKALVWSVKLKGEVNSGLSYREATSVSLSCAFPDCAPSCIWSFSWFIRVWLVGFGFVLLSFPKHFV